MRSSIVQSRMSSSHENLQAQALRVHEVVADVGVDRGRTVPFVAHLLLNEAAADAVLGQVGDVGMS